MGAIRTDEAVQDLIAWRLGRCGQGDLIDHAIAVRSPRGCDAIERGTDQSHSGKENTSIRPGKAVQNRVDAGGGGVFEDDSIAISAAAEGRAVEIALAVERDAAIGGVAVDVAEIVKKGQLTGLADFEQ